MTAVSETPVFDADAYVDGLTENDAFSLLITAAMTGVNVPGPEDEGIDGDPKVALKVTAKNDPDGFKSAVDLLASFSA